ncbi:glycosyltransferase [Gammaproteobacteria bacterium]|nr:glycosyltransferase [Gammaproteobacteria bacterium]
MQYFKKIIRSIYDVIPYKIKSKLRNFYNSHSKILTIDKSGNRNALIIYIKQPFLSDNNVINHCNVIESLSIRDVLVEMGYAIDVIDYRYKGTINYSKYDLIFGFGDLFAQSFLSKNLKKNVKRICYSTGTHPESWNSGEANRLKYFNNKFRSKLVPLRLWEWKMSTFAFTNSDGVIQTGNDWTKSTFNHLDIDKFFVVPVPSITQNNNNHENKVTGKDFIFFSGAGAVYKGLDLVIDAFKSMNQGVNLYIYGPFDQENFFMDIYGKIIRDSQNIFYNGVIDPMSDQFNEIVSKCSYTILPSCGESGASSVITTMHKGLIPVVTKNSSIDLFDFGVLIDSLSIESVKESIEVAINLSDNEILRQRRIIIDHINKNHSELSYKIKLRESLNKILG